MLAMIGITATIGRSIFTTDLFTHVEPLRSWILAAREITDQFAGERPALLQYIEGRFAAHPVLTALHILPGALLLLVAPLQFSARIRNGYRRFHRWTGRVLIAPGIIAAVPAFYFGVIIPAAGPAEALLIATATVFFLFAMGTAFLAIRRGQVARHREWMIRAFAAAFAISTVRIVATLFDVVLTLVGFHLLTIFAISMWTGWIVTMGVAESWIRHTRPRAG